MPKEKKSTTTIQISKSLHKKLKEIAQADRVPIGKVIEMLLERREVEAPLDYDEEVLGSPYLKA